MYAEICLKSLQEDAAEDIFRRHFQMQFSWHLKGYRVDIHVCLPVHLLVIHCKRAYNAPLAKLLFSEILDR